MTPDLPDVRGFQLLQQVIASAAADDGLRARLLNDPKAVLREAGLEISDEVELMVHENRPGRLNLILPSRPVDAQELNAESVDLGTILEWGF